MDDTDPMGFIAGLPGRLAAALGRDELLAATEPPAGVRVVRRLEPDSRRVGTRVLPSPLPRVALEVTAGIDVRALAEGWALGPAVAVSGDVHQRTWHAESVIAGVPDPHGVRVGTEPVRAGAWDLRVELTGRPPGALPVAAAGASPAYDIRERGGVVRRLVVTARRPAGDVVPAGHPDARLLLESMALAHPVARGGWSPDASTAFAVVRGADRPVGGAVLHVEDRGIALASHVCLVPSAEARDGAALLELLEVVALDRGARHVRLDASAFLHGARLPLARLGYVTGPPYDGDADVEVWTEREIAPA